MLYLFLRSSTKSLVSFFAIYSAMEDISFSGSLPMRLISSPLLTVTNPAFAALECQSICLLIIWLTNVLTLISFCSASRCSLFKIMSSNLKVILSLWWYLDSFFSIILVILARMWLAQRYINYLQLYYYSVVWPEYII